MVSLLSRRLMRCAFALLLTASPLVATAGNISFSIKLDDTGLTVTNLGDASAYYPAVFRFVEAGRWDVLAPTQGQVPAELLPRASWTSLWPRSRVPTVPTPLERVQPLLIRFFDSAGVGFGQIAFMAPPKGVDRPMPALYVNGRLELTKPAGELAPTSTWVLWAQEEGVQPLRNVQRFEHSQAQPTLIRWADAQATVRLRTGAALPSAMLLHERAGNYEVQLVASGKTRAEHRPRMLDTSRTLYVLAGLLAIAGASVLITGMWRRRMRPTLAVASGAVPRDGISGRANEDPR